MRPANDDEFFAETIGEWVFSILVSVGAVTAFVIALAISL